MNNYNEMQLKWADIKNNLKNFELIRLLIALKFSNINAGGELKTTLTERRWLMHVIDSQSEPIRHRHIDT